MNLIREEGPDTPGFPCPRGVLRDLLPLSKSTAFAP